MTAAALKKEKKKKKNKTNSSCNFGLFSKIFLRYR